MSAKKRALEGVSSYVGVLHVTFSGKNFGTHEARLACQGRGGRGSGRGGSGGAGGRGGGKAKKIQCPGYLKMLAPDELAFKSKFCEANNKIRDILYKAAARQGKTSWLSNQLANNAKPLFDKYKERCGAGAGAARRPGAFLLNVIEEIGTSTEVLIDDDSRASLS